MAKLLCVNKNIGTSYTALYDQGRKVIFYMLHDQYDEDGLEVKLVLFKTDYKNANNESKIKALATDRYGNHFKLTEMDLNDFEKVLSSELYDDVTAKIVPLNWFGFSEQVKTLEKLGDLLDEGVIHFS